MPICQLCGNVFIKTIVIHLWKEKMQKFVILFAVILSGNFVLDSFEV